VPMKNQWFSAINTRYELFENDGKTEAVLRFNSQEVLVNVYLYPRHSQYQTRRSCPVSQSLQSKSQPVEVEVVVARVVFLELWPFVVDDG